MGAWTTAWHSSDCHDTCAVSLAPHDPATHTIGSASQGVVGQRACGEDDDAFPRLEQRHERLNQQRVIEGVRLAAEQNQRAVTEIVDHYDAIVHELDAPPIIMGHSFGGVLTQMLADRGLGSAYVGVAPGQTAGEPPSRGSTILVNNGCTENSSSALTKIAAV